MAVKAVATPCVQWSQPYVLQSPSSSTKRVVNDVVCVCRTRFFGTTSSKLPRSRSVEFSTKQKVSRSSIRRVCSASFDEFSDEKLSPEIQELAFRLQSSDAGDIFGVEDVSSMDSRWPGLESEPSNWSASIEMRANRVDLPVSLRMIKRKKQQWQEEFTEAGESAYCSMERGFSSMVFIIKELHSFTLRMRELLFCEDMQGILERVNRELHASFVWLFQQVFSHTPTLMVYLMILLANFTVHSMSTSSAIAVTAPPIVMEESEASTTTRNYESSAIVKSCSVSSSIKATSVGGDNGGGRKTMRVANGTEGNGLINRSGNLHRPILPESVLPLSAQEEEEMELWKSMVEEASRMQAEGRGEAILDHETMQRFVSPVTAIIVSDDDRREDYHQTEVLYQTALAQDPNNVVLLANYAQFLYLIAHDYDRAEEYFKKAVNVEPKDAEAHSKYANFLWQVRNDLWAAEETFLEAISADPSNSFYAANYAHFLWNTGGEDTCFPLDDDNTDPIDNA